MISKVTTLWVLNIQLPQNNKGTKKKKQEKMAHSKEKNSKHP